MIPQNLRNMLEFIEDNIDIEHLRKVEELHLKAVNYEKTNFLPLTVFSDYEMEVFFPFKMAFNKPEFMMYNELLQSFGSAYLSVQIKDHFPLHIRSNHGIGIIPSLFGAEIIVNDNKMPWVKPLENRDEIMHLIQHGVPSMNSGLGQQVIDTYEFYKEQLNKYPKCQEGIKISQPDMQGPFDIAHLLCGSDIFYLPYESPKLLHDLMDIITTTYIKYRKFIEKYINDRAGENAVYVHGGISRGDVIIKEDTALATISPDMYRDFVYPYNQHIFDEFTGTLHYCGEVKSWHHQVLDNSGLNSINYGNPEKAELNNVYQENKVRNISIINWGYNQPYEFLEEIFENKISTGITLACRAENVEEGRNSINKYKKESLN